MTTADRVTMTRQVVIDVDVHRTGDVARPMNGSTIATIEVPANVGDDDTNRGFGEQTIDVVDREERWTRHLGVPGGKRTQDPIFAPGNGILESMDVQSMELFSSLLAVVAAAGVGVIVLVRLTASRFDVARQLADGLHGAALWLAWLVSAVATAGSLYFSEVADYVPCRLCWFQRIVMYPLAGILFVAAVRRDREVRWYALPLAVAGLGISTYHYVIEWKPSLGEGACAVGPSCTDIWFRELGFVTLAFMALAGFAVILALLFVTPPNKMAESGSE